jgi:hypothetical protein
MIQYVVVDEEVGSTARRLFRTVVTFKPGPSLFLVASIIMSSTLRRAAGKLSCACNMSSSSGFSIASIFGKITWALFNPINILPNEWGNNLKVSAYT